jgi:hypothetical protein
LPDGQSEIFLLIGLDRPIADLPVGQISRVYSITSPALAGKV